MAQQSNIIGDVLVWGAVAVGAYFLYEWYLSTAVPATPTPTPSPTGAGSGSTGNTATGGSSTTPSAQQSAATTVLTLTNITSLPYSGSITDDPALNAQLDTELQNGQVKTIAGNSFASFNLGWGNGVKGATKSIYGQTYTFDGTNWNLASITCPAGQTYSADHGGVCVASGVSGLGISSRAFRGPRQNYLRAGTPMGRHG
jgi:hypothetical protein